MLRKDLDKRHSHNSGSHSLGHLTPYTMNLVYLSNCVYRHMYLHVSLSSEFLGSHNFSLMAQDNPSMPLFSPSVNILTMYLNSIADFYKVSNPSLSQHFLSFSLLCLPPPHLLSLSLSFPRTAESRVLHILESILFLSSIPVYISVNYFIWDGIYIVFPGCISPHHCTSNQVHLPLRVYPSSYLGNLKNLMKFSHVHLSEESVYIGLHS